MQLLLTYVTGTCADCGRPILFGEESHGTHDGETVCGSCRDENGWQACDDCGRLVRDDETTYVAGAGDVCETCLNGSGRYVQCHDCDEWMCESDAYEIAGQYFCENCEGSWRECEDCGELIDCNHDDWHTTSGGRIICESCYEDSYFTCEDCGEVFHTNNEICIDDSYYCERCAEWHEHARGVMDYHEFPRSAYIPRATRADGADEPTFGVELECDGGSFDADGFADWTDDGDLVHFERDGSLSSRGVECITMPCTLRYHRERMRWPDLCAELKTQGFKSHDTSCCGLHVHIGRKNLYPTTVAKMDVFVNRAASFFSQVARRDVFYSSRYRTDKCLQAKKGVLYEDADMERYQAVNTSPNATVEIRIFRGTLCADTVVGTLEMLHALVRFLNGLPIGRIYETESNVLRFVDFCGENADDYPHLMPMLGRLVRNGACVANIRRWNERIEKSRQRKELKKCA